MKIPDGIVCFFDGCCEPRNPGGNMGVGAVIFKNGVKVNTHSGFMPAKNTNSNNVAEYAALEWILETLLEQGLSDQPILIYGDSKLVIEQMRGAWRIKDGFYVQKALACQQLLKNFRNIKLQWIPRDENCYADDLSKGQLIKNGVKFSIQPQGR